MLRLALAVGLLAATFVAPAASALPDPFSTGCVYLGPPPRYEGHCSSSSWKLPCVPVGRSCGLADDCEIRIPYYLRCG